MTRPLLPLLLLIPTLLLPAHASAERLGIASSEFGLLGVAALPVSGFAGTDIGEGHAKLGVSGGLDFLAHLTLPYLAWSTGLFYLWNPVEVGEDQAPSSYSPGSWLNIPLLTGLRLQTFNFGDALRLYGQVQGGVNLASQTDTEGPSSRVEVGWTPSLGLSFGVGAIVQNRIHLGVRYFDLGEPEYTLRSNRGATATATQKPRVLALMIGVYFDATN